jgi:hypothetical protein
MLLFLLRDSFREPHYAPSGPAQPPAPYAAELFASGLFLSSWCLLRLFAQHGDRLAADRALAVLCLAVGVWAMLRSLLGVARRVRA